MRVLRVVTVVAVFALIVTVYSTLSFTAGGSSPSLDSRDNRIVGYTAEGSAPPQVCSEARASSLDATPSVGSETTTRPTFRDRAFRFHIYHVPKEYIEGAVQKMEANWSGSRCNRGKSKTDYTMLDWRHAHSLFTVDTYIARYLRHHALHTDDPSRAEIFIIPMMTHLYSCAGLMHYMPEILKLITKLPYAKRMDGHDHYLFWWRWGMNHKPTLTFWKALMSTLPKVNLISYEFLELMGRNDDTQDYSLALKPKFTETMHSVVLPYPEFSPSFDKALPHDVIHRPRQIFFYFAGTSTIGGIRRWIKRACTAVSDPSQCLYEDFAKNVIDDQRLKVPTSYPERFLNTVFCGHAAGDGLSSRRPTTAVLAGCIPVLICDLCVYAFENLLNYSSFAVFVKEDDVIAGRMMSVLKAITAEEIHAKREALFKIRQHFTYNVRGPPRRGDALDTLVEELRIRADVLRSYRRWFTDHTDLSNKAADYPTIPHPVRKYIRAGVLQDEKDINNLQGGNV